MMKIGYQGIEGSNSEASARSMAARLGWTDVEYVPLVHSQGVVSALKAGAVDCGVMVCIRVAGCPRVWPDTAQGSVSGKHIEKCLLAEMGQLIKVEAANLASLPFT